MSKHPDSNTGKPSKGLLHISRPTGKNVAISYLLTRYTWKPKINGVEYNSHYQESKKYAIQQISINTLKKYSASAAVLYPIYSWA